MDYIKDAGNFESVVNESKKGNYDILEDTIRNIKFSENYEDLGKKIGEHISETYTTEELENFIQNIKNGYSFGKKIIESDIEESEKFQNLFE